MPKNISPFYNQYPIHSQKSFLYNLIRRLIMSPVYFQTKNLSKGCILLDYGCGDGSFLQSIAGCGYSLLGFEPSEDHASHLSKLLNFPIYSDMDGLSSYTESVDAVTMHFVLEHVTDPNQTFANVRKLLKPGGLFYIVVPNIISLESKLFGKKWHGLDPPRHISFPDKLSIQKLAEKHRFKLIQTRAAPFPNGFAGSMSVLFTGRFSFFPFLFFIPLGILFSRLIPTGTYVYWLKAI
jgi:SAM-dependent methyltransferase